MIKLKPRLLRIGMLNKVVLILFKYIPAIHIATIIFNDILYLVDNDDSTILWRIPYFLDGINGLSWMLVLLLFLISYKFKYCTWHRLLLCNCIINILITSFDAFALINRNDLYIVIFLSIISGMCCCIATMVHISYVRKGVRLCLSRHGTSSQFDHFLLVFIKWFPFIQLFCFLLSNSIAGLDWDIRMCYILDFSSGNSLLSTLLIYCLSLRLRLPNYHRWFVVANFINLSIAFCDANIYSLPLSNLQLYLSYQVAPCTCLILLLNNKIKSNLYEYKTQIA